MYAFVWLTSTSYLLDAKCIYITLYAVAIYVAPQLFRSIEENNNQSLFG